MHLLSKDDISVRTGGRQNLASVLAPALLSGVALIGLFLCLSDLESGAAPAAASPAMPATPVARDARLTGRPALRRLTFDGRSIPWAWTPDGQSVLVKRPGQRLPGQQLFELWSISLQEGGERRLAENAIQPAVEGSQVAFLRYIERGRWEVVVASLADGRPSFAGAAQFKVAPAWVGGEVVYLLPTEEWPAPTGAQRPPSLAALAEDYTRARLSSDGRRVAATDGRRLWVLESAGLRAVAQRAVARVDRIEGLAWSPVADRLAYVRVDGGPSPELWVWEAGTGRSWMLARGKLEYFGEPAWSPDGRTLAFVRQPTGNGGNTSGDIWLANVNEHEHRLYPLALTPTDEGAPRWSPDGRRLALAIEGDTWVAELDAPGLQAELAAQPGAANAATVRVEEPERRAPVAPLGVTAPLTIWVMHDDARNTCRDVPDGQIDALPFEQYVKQVVPNEVPALWPLETVKAQAVAARTYAWRKTLDRPYPAYPYAVRDSTADQYMCDQTHERSNAAVDATEGQYVGYGGKVIYSFYCAEAGDPTNYRMLYPAVPYLRSVRDPVGFGRTRSGHSWGMSQWGAYRWAQRHGWDYQQILQHYYTGAGVGLPASDNRLLAALTHPWPDQYVTADRALVSANAAGSGVLTVTFSARLTDTWTTIYTDVEAGDGWGVVWPVGSFSDTVTPSIGLRATAHDSVGQVAQSGIAWVGLNRAPPTGTLSLSPILTSPQLTTLTVPLALTAADPSPDRGPIDVNLGSGDWVWEEDALTWTGGEIVSDAAAGDGSAWHVGASEGGTLSGGSVGSLVPGRPYRAYFRLRAPVEALASAAELARLAVIAGLGSDAELLGVRYVRGTDVQAADVYQEFVVDFPGLPDSGEIEWRVDSFGTFDLWVDRIDIADYPFAMSPTISWTLPAREGPATIAARFVDGAGNTSVAIPLAVTVTDRLAPGAWRHFRCGGLACTVEVRDTIAGLDVSSAAARVSGDGGLTWSDWLPAACSGQDGSHDWETLAIGVAGMSPDAQQGRIQFRLADRASLPNEGLSPLYLYAQVFLPVTIR